MSGGHWNYLNYRLEERVGQPLNEVWRLLGQIEHELDWGICGDTCYDCAKIRTINALEAYFDTEATSIEDSLRILRSSQPECAKCKAWEETRSGKRPPEPRKSATIEFEHEGTTYKGVAYEEQQ